MKFCDSHIISITPSNLDFRPYERLGNARRCLNCGVDGSAHMWNNEFILDCPDDVKTSVHIITPQDLAFAYFRFYSNMTRIKRNRMGADAVL